MVKDYSSMYKKDSTKSSPQMLRRYLPIVGILAVLHLIDVCLAEDPEDRFRFGNEAIDNGNTSCNPCSVVIMDAGSTGTRVLVFQFKYSEMDRRMILLDELYHEIKPGLSFYADRPEDVKEPLETLLQEAKSEIQKSQWSQTDLKLRATAGLRLLPVEQSQAIIEESKKILRNSGFNVSEDCATVMKGTDEGVFSWFTANFLLQRFPVEGNDMVYSENTVAALDLGGASTQVTFAITPKMYLEQPHLLAAHKKDLYNAHVFNRNIKVFTHSWLGLGLMAARKAILMHPDNYKNADEKPDFSSSSSRLIEIHSECIHSSVSGAEWHYAGNNYTVKGPLNGSSNEDEPTVQFFKCLDIVKKVVDVAIPHDIPNFLEHNLYGFSYYFDRAVESGITDRFIGGVVTLKNIYKTASKICENPIPAHPFMCLDLSYIYTLLHDGFGFVNTTRMTLKKKIKQFEMSWGLGAAFHFKH